MKETIKVKGKAIKTVLAELKRRDFCTFDWEGNLLEAHDCFGGQVIKKAFVTFSEKGRAITDLVIAEA